ncbi:zinc ribbon domain-containing protein [Sphaerisporangium sp. NBC_01403]|uniref:zinc ribbon domain-containing protein n=1 Tax=Sphaerisporangium sp. NBC_01403 TaxID=2903599 RepID=UPI0038632CF1
MAATGSSASATASSRLCSGCGAIATSMPLDVREWSCVCGAVPDRDVNAAVSGAAPSEPLRVRRGRPR